MRLIDGDALKSALTHAAKDYCNRNGPMRTIDFESLIDNAPTIAAIPVEWLRQEADRQKDMGEWADADVIYWIIQTWQKEQEAQYDRRLD